MEKFIVFAIIANIYLVNSSVLLWSNKKLNVTPLSKFDDDDLNLLLEKLENPEFIMFRSSASMLSSNYKDVLDGYYSAFNPNGEINTENATDLLGDDDLDKLKIKQIEGQLSKSNNFLGIIYFPTKRFRREANNANETAAEPYKKAEGPVIYKGKNKKGLYSLLYSSQPLLLRINETRIYLGTTDDDMITVDSRLNVNIPLEDGLKITLRFSFTIKNGYWKLPSVKITHNNMNFNLTADADLSAAIRFSYHCSGETLFSDKSSNVDLVLYDMQVQTDAKAAKFGDAYDCVTFTTAPIWSGLFITGILGIGMVLALTAILDIKTMDKFDNAKTKNIAITVNE